MADVSEQRNPSDRTESRGGVSGESASPAAVGWLAQHGVA